MCHRTVSGAPGHSTLNLLPSGKWRSLRYNSPDRPVYAPDSVWWHTGLSGVSAEQRLLRANGRLQRIKCAPAHAEDRARAGGTPDSLQDLSGAPPDSQAGPHVRAPTVGTQRPGDMAGAPDCPVRHATADFQRPHFGGWGYKYPNHPTFNGIQVFHLQHITRAIAFNSSEREMCPWTISKYFGD